MAGREILRSPAARDVGIPGFARFFDERSSMASSRGVRDALDELVGGSRRPWARGKRLIAACRDVGVVHVDEV